MTFTALLCIALGTFMAFALKAGLRSYSNNAKPEHAHAFLGRHIVLDHTRDTPRQVLTREGEVLWSYDIETSEILDFSMSSASLATTPSTPVFDAASTMAFLSGTGAMTFQNLNTISQGKDNPTIAAVLLGKLWAERSVLNSFQTFLRPEHVLRLDYALFLTHRNRIAQADTPPNLP